MAIPCAIAGLGANLLDNQTMTEVSKDLNQELIKATKNALDAAHNEMKDNKNYSSSQLRIIEELSETEVQPQNFKSLIKKAESFQRYYCTEKDSDDIIRLFEKHLGVQIAGNSLLSQYFALSAHSFTVEKIQIVNALLDDNTKTIGQIVELLNDQDNHIKNIEKTGANIERRLDFFMDKASQILNEFTRIMLAVCVFLAIGIPFSARYEINVLIVVFSSYSISNLIVASLIKGQYIHEIFFNQKIFSGGGLRLVKDIFSVMLPLLLPLSCYFLLNYVIILAQMTIITVISLLAGSTIPFLFRTIKPKNMSVSSETVVSPQKEEIKEELLSQNEKD